MRFVWDAQKSQVNPTRRGFDFEAAALIFQGPPLERDDTRHDYGERRVVAIGVLRGDYLTIVYTDRASDTLENERRIISARPSSRNERSAYDETYGIQTRPWPSGS
jgi:uncharacterized DUF497 family protein